VTVLFKRRSVALGKRHQIAAQDCALS
jgi:hypothetical protein